jgi:5-methylcytosine-specific restriction endonuclease McrA
MTPLRSRRPRLRLDQSLYREVSREVMARDGWRCQSCGCSSNLQIHHINPRNSLGEDVEKNLITLCMSCHEKIHLKSTAKKGRTLRAE